MNRISIYWTVLFFAICSAILIVYQYTISNDSKLAKYSYSLTSQGKHQSPAYLLAHGDKHSVILSKKVVQSANHNSHDFSKLLSEANYYASDYTKTKRRSLPLSDHFLNNKESLIGDYNPISPKNYSSKTYKHIEGGRSNTTKTDPLCSSRLFHEHIEYFFNTFNTKTHYAGILPSSFNQFSAVVEWDDEILPSVIGEKGRGYNTKEFTSWSTDMSYSSKNLENRRKNNEKHLNRTIARIIKFHTISTGEAKIEYKSYNLGPLHYILIDYLTPHGKKGLIKLIFRKSQGCWHFTGYALSLSEKGHILLHPEYFYTHNPTHAKKECPSSNFIDFYEKFSNNHELQSMYTKYPLQHTSIYSSSNEKVGDAVSASRNIDLIELYQIELKKERMIDLLFVPLVRLHPELENLYNYGGLATNIKLVSAKKHVIRNSKSQIRSKIAKNNKDDLSAIVSDFIIENVPLSRDKNTEILQYQFIRSDDCWFLYKITSYFITPGVKTMQLIETEHGWESIYE